MTAHPHVDHPVVSSSRAVDRTERLSQSVRTASIVAGAGYLLLAILSGFGNFGVLAHLVTQDSAATTARAIEDSKGLFVLGIVSLSVVAVLDVIVAVALLKVFNPVDIRLSALAAGLRIVYAGVFAVAIGHLVAVLRVLGDPTRTLQGVNDFKDIWNGGLMLFGLHLIVVGYLAFKSAYVPNWLAGLLALAGFGYLFDSLAAVFSLGFTTKLASLTFVGEVAFIVWLLWKGRRISLGVELLSSPA